MAKTKEIADLQDIVERFAWRMFEACKSKEQAKIPRDHLEIHINWEKVKFIHEKAEFLVNPSPPKPSSSMLFKTAFVNRTESSQDYSFKTERTTRSSATVEVERGVTTGMEVSVSLKTPMEVFEANAGFSRETEVVSTESNTTDSELTWGVDSQIKVSPKTKTVAELEIVEREYQADYIVRSKVFGKVNIVFRNVQDNNKFVASIPAKIVDVVKKTATARESNVLQVVDQPDDYDWPIIKYQTTGKCSFKYGVEQEVKVTEIPLKE